MEQYIKLNSICNTRLSLLHWAKSSTNWRYKNAFNLAVVPQHLIVDTALKTLMNKFGGTPVIFRMDPWRFYRFHTDAARSCAINMLLEGTDSNTYYGTETEDEEILIIDELKYQMDNLYLINTHLKHSVINRTEVRYMFSMGFKEDVSFDQVKTFCQSIDLI
jgi:hypothetical protein